VDRWIEAASQVVWPRSCRRCRCRGRRWCRYRLWALLLLLLLLLLHCCSCGGEAWLARRAGLLLHLLCRFSIVLLLQPARNLLI
jgi:hypothetical protein